VREGLLAHRRQRVEHVKTEQERRVELSPARAGGCA
jgi:hypothetical protein